MISPLTKSEKAAIAVLAKFAKGLPKPRRPQQGMVIVGRIGEPARLPIRRMSVRDAKATVREAGQVVVHSRTGAAEVWNKKREAIGFLTRAQVKQLNL
jgi:hypothetical protein